MNRLEALADALLVGLFVFVASLPLVTAYSAFGAGCAVLRGDLPVRRFWSLLRVRWAPGVRLGSTVSGRRPMRPRTRAGTLPWPCPVAPSDPKSSTCTVAVDSSWPASSRASTNRLAATIGPTVWELDGPMPTLNRSKADRATSSS